MKTSLHGVGNKPAHQYLITCFIVELTARFEKYEKYSNLIAYPEFDLPAKKNPDVSIYIRKAQEEFPFVVIEICNSKAFDSDVEKVQKHLADHKTIQEGYVMNYETMTLYKIARDSKDKPKKEAKETDRIDAVSLPLKKVITRYNAYLAL